LWLQPGQSIRGWIDLRTERLLLTDAGKYKLRPRCLICRYSKERTDPRDYLVAGAELSFCILNPSGADAAAVKLIEDRLWPEKFRSPPPGGADNPGPPDEVHKWQDEVLRGREGECGTWVYRDEVLDLLRKAKSERFQVAASFYCGQRAARYADDRGRRADGQREYYARTVESLEVCLSSREASCFVKGMATLHLIQANYLGEQATLNETRVAVVRLAADYPGSAIADEGWEFLDQISKPQKKR
jgi:hypothetical protein